MHTLQLSTADLDLLAEMGKLYIESHMGLAGESEDKVVAALDLMDLVTEVRNPTRDAGAISVEALSRWESFCSRTA